MQKCKHHGSPAPTECDLQAAKAGELEDKFRKVAEGRQVDKELEIDSNPPVQLDEDDEGAIKGAYVQAWIYIPVKEVE